MNYTQDELQACAIAPPQPYRTEAVEPPLPVGEATELSLFDLTPDDRAALIEAATLRTFA